MLTVGTARASYIQARQPEWRPQSVKSIRADLLSLSRHIGDSRPLDTVGCDDVQDWWETITVAAATRAKMASSVRCSIRSSDSRGGHLVQQQPGWYSDPWQQNDYRWWTGTEWTANVWSRAQVIDDAVAAAPLARPDRRRGSAGAWAGFGVGAAIIVAVIVAVVVQAAPARQDGSVPSTTVAAAVTAPVDTIAPTTTPTPTTTMPPTTTTTKPKSEYPKEVPVSSIRDSRIRSYFTDYGYTVAVQLAPGIWANRGTGPLGDIDDYGGVVGLCADFHQYLKTHPVGGSCW